jgi:hypothetical protein
MLESAGTEHRTRVCKCFRLLSAPQNYPLRKNCSQDTEKRDVTVAISLTAKWFETNKHRHMQCESLHNDDAGMKDGN